MNYYDTCTVSTNINTDYNYYDLGSRINYIEKEISEFKLKEKKLKTAIKKYEILCPEKVIRVIFTDGKQEKLVCDKEDKFDLKTGLFISIAKHMYKDKYTLEGIEEMARELSYTKECVSMVNKAIKEHEKYEKTEKERIAKEKEEKRLEHEKRMERDRKRREHKIEIQKEAYLRAMCELRDKHEKLYGE